MKLSKLARRWVRPARDFLLGLGLYAIIAMSGIVDTGSPSHLFGGSAHARLFEPQPGEASASFSSEWAVTAETIAAATDQRYRHALTSAMLAFAFASLFSLNMWFARHLRHAHLNEVRAARRRNS